MKQDYVVVEVQIQVRQIGPNWSEHDCPSDLTNWFKHRWTEHHLYWYQSAGLRFCFTDVQNFEWKLRRPICRICQYFWRD